jgi:tryptophan halogenase
MTATREARTITIIGGGTAGWMTAAALGRFLAGPDWTIRLVESDAIGTVGVGEATIPQLHLFNRALGLDENAFVAATQGTFKLGIAFDGWRQPGHSYMHGFGTVGRDLGLLSFYHYWLAARLDGMAADNLDDCTIAAVAGRLGRFTRPDLARPAPAGGHNYAFHFDASLYAAYLRNYAEARGVTRHEGRIAGFDRDAATGDISAAVMDDGRRIDGDLFIDCSGFAALLIEQQMEAGFESWQHWLPCDRAWAVPSTDDGPPLPYTRSIARPSGWQWRIPLQHRTGTGHVYCSAMMADDEAAAILLANLPGRPLADLRPLRFTAGRRHSVWVGNVIAIGLSSGFLEPLESTSIHLIQSGIERLLKALPSGRGSDAERTAFNAEAAAEMESIRDFIILHYWANGRDEPFWRDRRETSLPDSLKQRIDLFRATGRLAEGHGELFTPLAWQQVMIGQGLLPDAVHPLASALPRAQRDELLSMVRRAVAGHAAAMPMHTDFLATHCPSTPRERLAS